MKRQNNILGNMYSDEWHTDQETVDLVCHLLSPKGVICCPFDSSASLFVQAAENVGRAVYGMRDWLDHDYEYDYLMTNPPFSIKDKVIERVMKSGKPSALVLPLDSLGGVKRHKLYSSYGYPAVYVPSRRISYFDSLGIKRKASNFHSVILLFHTNRQGIIWEGQENESRD